MDYLVLDVETKNTFFDVGRENIDKLEISVVCVYSYNQNKYLSFDEYQMPELAELLKNSNMIIGFCSNRFDIPVINNHCGIDLFKIPRIDLLEEIEVRLGRRISLNLLAKVNLGVEKTGHGLDAPILYREGKISELKEYCQNDVKITKDLYELAKKQGFLLVPDKLTGEDVRVEFEPASLSLV